MIKNKLVIGGALLGASVALTTAFEGTKLVAYRDIGGVATACTGETDGVRMGMRFTKEQCDNKLIQSLIKHNTPFEKIDYDIPDKIHLAFLDITYNIGIGAVEKSTAYRMLKLQNYDGACRGLLAYKYAAGRDCSIRSNGCFGVWNRRQVEFKLCTNQITVDDALQQLGVLPIGGELQ
jgi:lysozyme